MIVVGWQLPPHQSTEFERASSILSILLDADCFFNVYIKNDMWLLIPK